MSLDILKLPFLHDVTEARLWLDRQPTWPGSHVFNDNPYFSCYRSEAILRCPTLLDLFNDPRILAHVARHLECRPTLYSVNGWWSFPAPNPQIDHAQHFHRDIDDTKFLTMFLYLTDVDADCGPHQVIPDTESRGPQGGGSVFSDLVEEMYRAQIVTAIGPAGTLWLVNTKNLHRGLCPKKPRLATWARYGYGPNCNSVDKEHAPIPWTELPCKSEPTEDFRHTNRMMVDFSR